MIRFASPDAVGPALGELRRLLGISQVQLASDAGLWPSQLSHWESGNRHPDLASLAKVAAGFGFDLALAPREDTP
jgi:transcriptional regulator with XRE-family HTH domain